MAMKASIPSMASAAPRYRRSPLTKAPRKRSFIAQMEKGSKPALVPIMASSRGCINASVDDGASSGAFGGGPGGPGRRFTAEVPSDGGNGQALPQASLLAACIAAVAVVSILSSADEAQAAVAPAAITAPAGYFAVAGFSSAAPKVVRKVAGAIPYGVVELSPKELRWVSGSLSQLFTRETVRV